MWLLNFLSLCWTFLSPFWSRVYLHDFWFLYLPWLGRACCRVGPLDDTNFFTGCSLKCMYQRYKNVEIHKIINAISLVLKVEFRILTFPGISMHGCRPQHLMRKFLLFRWIIRALKLQTISLRTKLTNNNAFGTKPLWLCERNCIPLAWHISMNICILLVRK
jgi:hypothetical protein